jgi:hypothetical protein
VFEVCEEAQVGRCWKHKTYESLMPFSPTNVASPLGNSAMNSAQLAASHAAWIISSVASLSPFIPMPSGQRQRYSNRAISRTSASTKPS